jgi:phosphoserine phosphatase
MKKVIFCDVDGTLVNRQLQDYLFYIQRHYAKPFFLYYGWLLFFVLKAPLLLIIDHLFDRRIANKLFYQNYKGIELDWYLNFIPKMIKEFVSPALNKKVIGYLEAVYDENTDIYLLSGNDENILKNLKINIPVKKVLGTELAAENRYLTGKIKKSMVGLSKKSHVQEMMKTYLDPVQITVLTDHHSDSPLLDLADIKIAVNPSKKLRQMANQFHWKIIE